MRKVKLLEEQESIIIIGKIDKKTLLKLQAYGNPPRVPKNKNVEKILRNCGYHPKWLET